MSSRLIPGTGNLTVNRTDFQHHIDGSNFQHNAPGLNLSPAVVVDGISKNTVQEAIAAIAALVPTPTIDATTAVKGVVQLAGDLDGTATNVSVKGLRGRLVSNTTPTTGQFLKWDGSAWIGDSLPVQFTAGGDLTGTATSQQLQNITGSANLVRIACSNFYFNNSVTSPTIAQYSVSSGNGTDLTISGQGTSAAGATGGTINIVGGSSTGALGAHGKGGGVNLSINHHGIFKLVQLVEPIDYNRIISLASSVNVTSTQMPSGTGDGVIYIGDALKVPIASPVDGTILYSTGGKLYIRQEDDQQFAIGSNPNPYTWGNTGEQTYTYRVHIPSPPNTIIQAFSYAVPVATAVYVEVTACGICQGITPITDSIPTIQYKGVHGFERAGDVTSILEEIGTQSDIDSRATNDEIWTYPLITTDTGTNILIGTGNNFNKTVDWTIIVNLTIST